MALLWSSLRLAALLWRLLLVAHPLHVEVDELTLVHVAVFRDVNLLEDLLRVAREADILAEAAELALV